MTTATTQEIASEIATLAAKVADCKGLDNRDRNTAIGMLRNAAAFIRGAEGMPGFAQAAYAPTKPAIEPPPADSLPNTPIRT